MSRISSWLAISLTSLSISMVVLYSPCQAFVTTRSRSEQPVETSGRRSSSSVDDLILAGFPVSNSKIRDAVANLSVASVKYREKPLRSTSPFSSTGATGFQDPICWPEEKSQRSTCPVAL